MGCGVHPGYDWQGVRRADDDMLLQRYKICELDESSKLLFHTLQFDTAYYNVRDNSLQDKSYYRSECRESEVRTVYADSIAGRTKKGFISIEERLCEFVSY